MNETIELPKANSKEYKIPLPCWAITKSHGVRYTPFQALIND